MQRGQVLRRDGAPWAGLRAITAGRPTVMVLWALATGGPSWQLALAWDCERAAAPAFTGT